MGKVGPKPKREEVVWSPEVAYTVGLIATNGCLYPDSRHLSITSKDRKQIENIKSILSISAKTAIISGDYSNDERIYYRVQWGDVTLYKFLTKVGLTSNKSLTIGELRLPDQYFFDFLRGHHDGDGCFYSYFDSRWKNSYMFYLCFSSVSKIHLEWLR